MSDQAWISQLEKSPAIAVIRAPKLEWGYQMALAVANSGMRFIEITWNSERAGELVTKLRSELPNCKIGCGTLLSLKQMQAAISAGAEYIFTPHVETGMIQAAVDLGVPINPGALTATEIVTAWKLGASCVKVFPVQAVGGVDYIKSLQGPLGHIPLIPTGGVTLNNASDFLRAGAIAVGLSGDLFPKKLVETGNWDGISQQAQKLMHELMSN